MPEVVPVAPRLAATVLLIRDDPFEVLMIRRRAGDSFGSALVFPGGVVDPEDRHESWRARLTNGQDLAEEPRALRIAALRELHEEAGVIAAAIGEQGPCGAGTAFGDTLGAAQLDLKALVPFAHWITPVDALRRFDTHFFLCAAPAGVEAICDGAEAVALEWASPKTLLARAEAGERALLFPTRMTLARLGESGSVSEAMDRARANPPRPILVEIEPAPGGAIHRLPAGSGYPVSAMFLPH